MTNCEVITKADISKNDVGDKQKVSKAENHKKAKPFNIHTQTLKAIMKYLKLT